MSTANNTQSAPVPRFRLSTLFTLFACAAIGLATTRDLEGATWTAIEAAMVIGLLQQSRELLRWHPEIDSTAGMRNARAFAIVWRSIIAAALAFFIVIELTAFGSASLYPDRPDLYFYEPVQIVALLLPILVLANSVRRWRPSVAAGPSRRAIWTTVAGAMLVIAAFNVVDARLTDYLVHRATADIEASITPGFQRPGVYPELAKEGFRSFWIAFAAAASVPLGSAFLICASKYWRSIRGTTSAAVFALCLFLQLFYCQWFYMTEYHRVSPELAGAGFAAQPSDLPSAAILLAMFATPTAYFLAANAQNRSVVTNNIAYDLDSRSIYETAPFVVILGLYGAINLITCLAGILSNITSPILPVSQPGLQLWMNVSLLTSPLILLLIVPSLLALQLCFYRWKQRRSTIPWEITALPRAPFVTCWMAVAATILIGVPTLAAFGFMFWLGPFKLTGI
jgi:hypothetical protein